MAGPREDDKLGHRLRDSGIGAGRGKAGGEKQARPRCVGEAGMTDWRLEGAKGAGVGGFQADAPVVA